MRQRLGWISSIYALAFVCGLASSALPWALGCSATGVSNTTVADPTISGIPCAPNLCNLSTTWSNWWTIDNNYPTQPACVGWKIQIVQEDPNGGGKTISKDTMWVNATNIDCDQTYRLNNQAFNTTTWAGGTWSCSLACHTSTRPYPQYSYAIYLFVASCAGSMDTQLGNTFKTNFVATGC